MGRHDPDTMRSRRLHPCRHHGVPFPFVEEHPAGLVCASGGETLGTTRLSADAAKDSPRAPRPGHAELCRGVAHPDPGIDRPPGQALVFRAVTNRPRNQASSKRYTNVSPALHRRKPSGINYPPGFFLIRFRGDVYEGERVRWLYRTRSRARALARNGEHRRGACRDDGVRDQFE